MLRRLATLLVCTLLLALTTLTACSDDPTSEPPPTPTPDPIEVSVEGAVADTTGAAVEGAEVTVYPGGGDSALDEGATGEDGSYALSFTAEEDEAPEVLRLTFDAEGYAPEEATIDFAASITYNAELTPEAGDDDGEDDDPAEATASGTVINANTDGPIEGATITGTAEGAELFTTTTTADGTYEATFAVADEPGEIIVAASAEGYEDAEQAVSFAEQMTADFQLEPVDPSTEATISGAVTDAGSGDPVEGAPITGSADGNELFTTATTADGTYAATFIVADEPGEITLTASAEGYEDAGQTISFAEQMTADFQLEPVDTSTEATISGVVTDGETGDPVEAVTVKGETQGTELFSATTAADGSYASTFTVADEPNEITLTATVNGYEDAEQTVSFAEQMTADFALQPVDSSTEASISGTVTDEDTGDPIEGASITGAAGGAELFSATTDGSGSYASTFTVADEPNEITLTATADGYEEAQQSVAFAEEMTADFALQPVDTSTRATISGAVTDNDTGDPIEGAAISGAADGAELFSTTTGSDGSYTASFTVEEEPDEITLTATADDYEQGQQTIPFAVEMTADVQLARILDEFTITATVVNADDEPVEGITVTSNEPDLAGTTDSGGQVTFTYTEVPGLSEITLTHTDPGGLYEDASVSINANEDVTYTATLEDITVEATASGTVTDDEGAPIEGATVTFTQDELGIDASTTTGTGGTYTLALGEVAKRNLGQFALEATAAAEGYESATAMPTLEESISQDFTLVSLTQTVTFTVSPRQITTNEIISNTVYAQAEGEEEQLWPVTGGTATVTLDVEPDTYIELGIPDDQKLANNISNAINVYNKNRSGPIIDTHRAIASVGPKRNYDIGDTYPSVKVYSDDINGEDLELGMIRHLHIINGEERKITDLGILGAWFTTSLGRTYGFNSGTQNIDTMRVVIPTYNKSDPSLSLDDYLLDTAEEAANDVMDNMYFPYTITYIDSPDELEQYADQNYKNTQIIFHEYSSAPSNGFSQENDIWESGRVNMTIAPQSYGTYFAEINESFTASQNPPLRNPDGQLNTSAPDMIRFLTQAKPGTTTPPE